MFQELAKQIDDYTSIYEPEDQLEWSMVLGEIRSFIEVGRRRAAFSRDQRSKTRPDRLAEAQFHGRTGSYEIVPVAHGWRLFSLH